MRYVGYLRQMVRDKIIVLYAFCLRYEETRLVFSTEKLSISSVMQRINSAHAHHIHASYRQEGAVYGERYKSILFPVDQIAQVVRGVHLTPLRDNKILRPERYVWSSHRAYLERNNPNNEFLTTAPILSQFSSNDLIARRAFARFVEETLLDFDEVGLTERFPGIGGDVEWAQSVLKKLTKTKRVSHRLSLAALAKRVGLLLNLSPRKFKSQSRAQEIVVARRLLATFAVLEGRRTVTELARYLDRDKAQISRLVSQGLDLLNHDSPFVNLFQSIRGAADSS